MWAGETHGKESTNKKWIMYSLWKAWKTGHLSEANVETQFLRIMLALILSIFFLLHHNTFPKFVWTLVKSSYQLILTCSSPALCSLESVVLANSTLSALMSLAPLTVVIWQNPKPRQSWLPNLFTLVCKQLSTATEYHQQNNWSTTEWQLPISNVQKAIFVSPINSLHTHYTSTLFQPLQTSKLHFLSSLPLESRLTPLPHRGNTHPGTRILLASCSETYKPTTHLYRPLPLSSQQSQGIYLQRPFIRRVIVKRKCYKICDHKCMKHYEVLTK